MTRLKRNWKEGQKKRKININIKFIIQKLAYVSQCRKQYFRENVERKELDKHDGITSNTYQRNKVGHEE
jgi:hypothetical protein